MNKIETITKLTDQWYKLIGKDHHKDRDCHFYIETKWSYGQPPKYYVSHRGYILDDIYLEHETYEECLDGMIKLLEEAIKREEEFKDTVEDYF